MPLIYWESCPLIPYSRENGWTIERNRKEGAQMSLHEQSRRSVLKTGGMLGLGIGVMSMARQAAAACGLLTPEQIEGPFYPGRRRDDENYDLTQVEGREGRALGEVI